MTAELSKAFSEKFLNTIVLHSPFQNQVKSEYNFDIKTVGNFFAY